MIAWQIIRKWFGYLPNRIPKVWQDELVELHRIAAGERYKANLFAQNTAVLNMSGWKGVQELELQQKVADICESVVRGAVRGYLVRLGYDKNAQVGINALSGRIFKVALPEEKAPVAQNAQEGAAKPNA